jgi:7-keto-8-aminopelargonate synthetase-like enzyme
MSDKDDVAVSYDVDNEFFRLWLDRRMNYTGAVFSEGADDDLEAAQLAKLAILYRYGKITPGSRVLDIGCGCRYGFMLYLDEAHSLGVLGATGRGATEHWGVRPGDVDILMGTLSKALASCGGYVAGQARLIEYLRYTTPGFVYSVGLPPAAAGAAVAALGLLRAEPERVARLRANAELFRRRAAEAGLGVAPGPAPVVPVITGTSASALLLADRMRRRGVNVQPIVYPAVPDAAARLRFFLNASHTDAQIEEAVAVLAQEANGPAPVPEPF